MNLRIKIFESDKIYILIVFPNTINFSYHYNPYSREIAFLKQHKFRYSEKKEIITINK